MIELGDTLIIHIEERKIPIYGRDNEYEYKVYHKEKRPGFISSINGRRVSMSGISGKLSYTAMDSFFIVKGFKKKILLTERV